MTCGLVFTAFVEWTFVGRPSNSRGSVLLYHRQKLTLVACDTPASFSSSNISSGESWWIMVNPFHSDSVTGRLGDPSIAQCYCAGMSSPRARKFASWTDWAWCAVSCGCTEEMSNIFAIADLSIPFHTYLRYSQITIDNSGGDTVLACGSHRIALDFCMALLVGTSNGTDPSIHPCHCTLCRICRMSQRLYVWFPSRRPECVGMGNMQQNCRYCWKQTTPIFQHKF